MAATRKPIVSAAMRKAVVQKPEKPYPDFPLFPHATKRWAKKIRGKLHYFGRWDDPEAALQRYLDQRDDLYAGRKPRVTGDGLAVRDVCNRFLTVKLHQRNTGEITSRTFQDYFNTCAIIVNAFGKRGLVDDLASDDFEQLRAALATTRGLVALGNEVQRVRVVFKYAYDAGLIDKPLRYGPAFKRPSRKVLRKERSKNGPKMFEAHEINAMLDAASHEMKAMVLLGINCGFGNSDCGTLPLDALDLDGGWVNYPRPKTGVERRCPLWPQTVQALRVAIELRPIPKDEADESLVFITKYGTSWVKDTSANPISAECRKLIKRTTVKRLGKNIVEPIYRKGVGFYALRHTFETIGGDTRDQIAVNHIMGHAPASSDMSSVYRERIDDERLMAVTEHVRQWLYASQNRE